MALSKIKVLLVDDHELVRAGFRRLLEDGDKFEVVAESGSGEQAVQDFNKYHPDVVVMDISMPGIGGVGAIERIVAREPNAKILVLSVHEDSVFTTRAMQAGALGFIPKRSAPEEMLKAVDIVAQGRTCIAPEIAQQIAMQKLTGSESPLDVLSQREFEVFRLLAEGKTVNDIADILNLSPKTVGTHHTNIKQKLNVSNAAELARLAIRSGLLDA
ncbi:two component transcriptional regulator, LuxR family [Methylophaga frappieri]|uniref:Two component transcriptional regulator, LuxR family n=1 Tax=Methylophaga frappieri (strain ATCC BAA-2434 / DSM 25690 / JAM7) TaxID=754477 RepID=I1YI16_METFJ|nr:response regulator [Methylophaga frappieri]AFJ02559.1 two component transcriptional regulator, LuxR family [Methylophaga frappieri]